MTLNAADRDQARQVARSLRPLDKHQLDKLAALLRRPEHQRRTAA